MATYKVLQDIEAEDKLVGPLTLRQFIYAGIAAVSGYLGFITTAKGAPFMLALFVPITGVCGFFAFPWRQDQPTEVWALAKIRFFLKPRKRIWNQSGAKELVTITAPKKIERQLTNGLNQDEVHNRLSALANTIDSRGWAIKNVNVNMFTSTATTSMESSDRLVQPNNLPQEVSSFDVRASDDMLDETANPVAQHFDTMIAASTAEHHRQILAQMQQQSTPPKPQPKPVTSNQPPANYWFLQQPQPQQTIPGQATFVDAPTIIPGAQLPGPTVPQAATPTAEEEALIPKLKEENASQSVAYGHLKTLKTPEQLMEEAAIAHAAAVQTEPMVTPQTQAAIMSLANNDDLDVATIARQAHKEVEQSDDGEVIISLH